MYLDALEARARKALADRYSVKDIWQIERLDKHFFRAYLTGGQVVLAMLDDGGGVTLRELEAVC